MVQAMSPIDSPKSDAVASPTSQTEPKEPDAFSWKALLSTYLPALVLALGTGIALPAVPTLAKSFDVSFGVASGVVSAYMLGSVAGTIPTGWLIDRFGLRWVMILGPVVTSAAALLVSNAHSFTELLILRFIGGCSAQMWVMGRLAAISKNASAAQRGRQVSWMFGMDNTGMLAGPLVGGYIASHWGPGAPFFAFSIIALLALIPTLVFGEVAAGKPGAPAKKNAVKSTLSMREIVMPRLIFFSLPLFAGLTRGPVGAGLLHLYAAFTYQLGPVEIGYMATGAAFLSWPIGFLAGWIMDRFGRKMTMAPGFAGVAISMILLAISAYLELSLSWYVALFFIAVAMQALTGGSLQTVGADVAPAEARGTFLGLWRFTGQGGGALSPIFFALIADQVNYGAAFLFTAAAAALIVFLILFRVPETRIGT